MLRIVKAVAPAAILLAAIAGCADEQTSRAEPVLTGSSAVPPQREAVVTPKAEPRQAAPAQGRQRTSYAFPTGHEETSVLLVERDLPTEIVAGQEFSYDIKVTNVNHAAAKGVTVRDDCATGLTVLRTEPAPLGDKQPLSWSLGDLNPGESRTIHIVGKTDSSQPFTSCASATYNTTLCLTAPVVKPSLRLTLSAPGEGNPCDPIPVKLTVTNTGTGDARDVLIAYPLPPGWTTSDGKSSVQLSAGTLAANQTREFTVNANASKTGEFVNKATASGAPALKAESAQATTTVRQAVLGVKAEGPEHVYAGRPVTLTFTVANTGTAPASAAVFEAPLPPGVKFVSATDGGAFKGGVVSWRLEPIAVKASKTLSLTVEPGAIGGIDVLGTARAFCAQPASAPINVSVFGIPALLLEVTDLTDPVPVGGETTYQIVVTNQGSAAATNVKLVATLEASEQYLSASGGKVAGGGEKLAFEPIASIPAKGVVTLTVKVKCIGDGDTRFRVLMTADQLTRPVEESESTFIYR